MSNPYRGTLRSPFELTHNDCILSTGKVMGLFLKALTGG